MTRKEQNQIAEIQTLIGDAMNSHANDRDPYGYEKAQAALKQAFNLCVQVLAKYPPPKPSKLDSANSVGDSS